MDLKTGVKQSGARAVAISITHLLDQHPLVDELRKFRRNIGNEVNFFVGGRAVADYAQMLGAMDAIYINNIEQFSATLNSLSSEKNG